MAAHELTPLQKALFAVIRQCTLVDDATTQTGKRVEAERLVELSREVVRQVG